MMSTVPALTVGGLLDARPEAIGLAIDLLAGARGLDRRITNPYIQKTGLALAGYHEYLQPGRVLIYGESEVRYLEQLGPERRREALAQCFATEVPCVLITGGLEVPADVAAEAERAGVPLLATTIGTATAIGKLTALLEDRLAVREVIHGVLLDILGLGVLIVGESGIGKSECALDLVVRGHRLVADDTVEIRRRAASIVIGSCPELTRHHMEVRGLGLINIRDLFGVASTRTSKRVELVVQLDRWDPLKDYERLGLDDAFFELLGLKIPLIRMPVAPGAQPGDSGRSGRAQPAAAHARHQRGARARGQARRAPPRADRVDRATSRRRRGSRARGRAVSRRKSARKRRRAGFIVISGLSGGGKSHAIRALEDLGYYCVDNLPSALIPVLADLTRHEDADNPKVAVVVDVRERRFMKEFPRVWRKLKATRGPRSAADLSRSE